MVDPSHTFHVVDYAVFGCTIVISVAIGFFYALSGGRQRTTSEYLVGGRTMRFMPVAISLMVSFESSIMMLGLPAEMYVYGTQWWIATVAVMISHLMAIQIIVPLFHSLKITSVYEYLELRFKSFRVRLLGSALGMIGTVWYMGIVLFGPAIALEAVTGFSQWSSIFVVACVAVLYTTIGGIKAVIWTDVFQALVMYSGMMAILIKGTIDVGNPTEVWRIAGEGGRLNFLNFDIDPRTRHTFWNLFVGSLLKGFGYIFNQSTVQRISSIHSERDAKRMMMVTIPCHFAALTLACYEGIVAYAYFQSKGCDPLASKKITNPNQVIPFTVMDIFLEVPGMPGLFLASLFSASLSTLSSGLSSISALFWTDFIKPRVGQVSEFKATIIAKVTVVVSGGIACGVALLVGSIGGPLTQITGSLLTAFSGPLCGIFMLGSLTRKANAKGVILGGLLSMFLTAWIGMGKSFVKNVRRQPWLPAASVDKCLANHSLSLMDVTTSSGLDSGVTGAMLGISTGVDDQEGYYYDHLHETTMASVGGSTTVVPEAEGIQQLYTLSYMWLGPLGTLTCLILGYLISLCTGGNKEGEVDPRYVLSLQNILPKSLRKCFGCADEYSPVQKADLAEPEDLFIKETIIPPPSPHADGVDDVVLPLTPMSPTANGTDATEDAVRDRVEENGV